MPPAQVPWPHHPRSASRHRAGGPGEDLRGVQPGGHRLDAEARGDRSRAHAYPAVRGAPRRRDVGRERGRQGIDLYVYASGEAVADELVSIVEENEDNGW